MSFHYRDGVNKNEDMLATKQLIAAVDKVVQSKRTLIVTLVPWQKAVWIPLDTEALVLCRLSSPTVSGWRFEYRKRK